MHVVEALAKIGAASPDTAPRVAVWLYESLDRQGHRREADRAFRDATVAPIEGEGAKLELLGMECLLKDGLVSYLKDFTKITPAIPKQVYTL